MSDPKSNYGRPVVDPAAEDDVVGRAHDSLAEAEAAQRNAVSESRDDPPGGARDTAASEPAAEPLVRDDGSVPVESAAPVQPVAPSADRAEAGAEGRGRDHPESDAAAPAPASVYSDPPASAADVRRPEPDTADDDDEDTRYAMYEASAADETASSPARDTTVYPREAETVVVAPPPVTTAEPAAPQPIFVQAPEPPRPRGNRGAAGAIGLLAALCFAVLYLGAWLAVGAIAGFVTGDNIGETLLAALATWSFWVPVIVFFIAFWLLGAIINRGRWGAWVIFGLLVGLAAYAGHILGQLFQAPFWTLTAREGGELVAGELLAPLAIAAFVIGRELTIWFGSWVAARGRRVTELNDEAQREYERTLEAGPQLARL